MNATCWIIGDNPKNIIRELEHNPKFSGIRFITEPPGEDAVMVVAVMFLPGDEDKYSEPSGGRWKNPEESPDEILAAFNQWFNNEHDNC